MCLTFLCLALKEIVNNGDNDRQNVIKLEKLNVQNLFVNKTSGGVKL